MGCATSLPEDEFVPPSRQQAANKSGKNNNNDNGKSKPTAGGTAPGSAKSPPSATQQQQQQQQYQPSQQVHSGSQMGFQSNPLMSSSLGNGIPMAPGGGGTAGGGSSAAQQQTPAQAFAAQQSQAQSRPAQGLDADGTPLGLTAHFPKTGPLKLAEYKERLVTSNGTQSVYLAGSGCTLRYAYVTQRGYYPEAPDKTNQDSFCVMTNFGGDLEQMFFGVFDGHGEFGTQCSQFARRKVRVSRESTRSP
jgi:hypothetical protein